MRCNSEAVQGGNRQRRMIGKAYANPLVKLYKYEDVQAPAQCAGYRVSKISQRIEEGLQSQFSLADYQCHLLLQWT